MTPLTRDDHVEPARVEHQPGGERVDFRFVHLDELLGFDELSGIRIEVLPAGDVPFADRDKLGGQPLIRLRMEFSLERPVFGAAERDPFPLPFDDDSDRNALYAPGRKVVVDLVPEEGRDFIAEKPVDDPPRFLRLDEILVDLARSFQRRLDRLFGDFVEDEPIDRHPRL